VGAVLAVARIRSEGLALAITLHAYALDFVLLCDQIVADIQG
jgi:hypothetical protein